VSCRALIDIGTNSVKLLVAELADSSLTVLLDRNVQTRLGRGFYESHRLLPGPLAETARVVADFARQARSLGAVETRAVATSAAREAVNAQELLAAIRSACGLEVQVVSGQQEAEWSFRGVTGAGRAPDSVSLILDVGGGSSEFILGGEGGPSHRQSFAIGVVRLLAQVQPGEPPAENDLHRCLAAVERFLKEEVAGFLRPALASWAPRPVHVLGTGGTATVLAAMELGLRNFDRQRLEGTRLSSADLDRHLRRLWGLPLVERRQVPGLPPERADVILTGVAIYWSVVREFGFTELRISTRGMRYGAIVDGEIFRRG
jgi:exopolyphosphatase/guanosine-5'-triphosphate,3'-diphosphate pyrophosphatase